MVDMQASSTPRPKSFLINVLWSWLAVAANIFSGIILTRYIIRKLGDERYGIWALTFSLIEYVFLFDLGFRSAIVTFVSRRRTEGDAEGINQIINTALAYFSGVAVIIAVLTLILSKEAFRWFQISEQYRADFSFLLILIGFTWSVGIISNIFQACLEASQNFRIYSHILVIMLVLRSGGCALLVYFGYGLMAMGLMVVFSQFLGYLLMFLAFRHSYPEARFSRSYMRASIWKELAGFGIHSLVASSGLLFLNQGPPLLVGHFRSEAFVGYYTVPIRLLQSIVDIVTRIGFVTVPKTTELLARGETGQIVKLGIFINRYCLALFLPVTIFLGIYGRELVNLWLGPTYANQSGPLIPVFVAAIAFSVAGQFNSSQLLFGMGVHQLYAKSLVVESLAMLAGMALILPLHGIYGAACVASILMVVNRGLITPMMVCYHLKVNYFSYMSSIYSPPLITALPVAAVAFWLKQSGLAGHTLIELILAGGLITTLCFGLSYFTCLEAEHRALFWKLLQSRLPQRTASVTS